VTCRPYDHQLVTDVVISLDGDQLAQTVQYAAVLYRWNGSSFAYYTTYKSPLLWAGVPSGYLNVFNLPAGYYEVHMAYAWWRSPTWLSGAEQVTSYIENGSTLATRNYSVATWNAYCTV
jgi:hypothetical protein